MEWRIASCVLAAFAFLANGGIIFLIITRPRLHKTHNWSVLSLAVADLCLAVVSIPRVYLCKFDGKSCLHSAVFYSFWFFVSASTTSVCCLAVDRLISVQWPLRYPQLMTVKRVAGCLATAWLVSALFVGTFLSVKLHLRDDMEDFSPTFSLVYVSVMVVLPTVFLVFVTFRVARIVRKLSREMITINAQLNFNHRPDSAAVVIVNSATKARSSLFIMIAIVSCFTVCHSVAAHQIICQLVRSVCPHSKDYPLYLTSLLFVLNAALDPIANALLSSDLKNELRGLCGHSSNPFHQATHWQLSDFTRCFMVPLWNTTIESHNTAKLVSRGLKPP